MAYVAISRTLIADTHNTISQMCEKEKALLPAVRSELLIAADDPTVEAFIWGQHLHLKDQIPDNWKDRTTHLMLRVDHVLPDETPITSTFKLTAQNSGSFVVPRTEQRTYYGYYFNVSEQHPLLPQDVRDYAANQRNCFEIEQKWKSIDDQVKRFLESAKSLNEALKLWPALSMYIAPSYIERVKAATSRSATVSGALDVLNEIQTDEITAAAVAHKLSV